MRSLLNKVSIQLSAGVAVFFTLAILVAGYGWIVSHEVDSAYRQEVEREQQLFLANLADQIDSKLAIAKGTLEAVATQVTPALYEDPDAGQAFLDRQAALLSIFDLALFLVAEDGRIVVESPFIAGGRNRDISYREFFQIPGQTRQTYISRPYASKHAADRPAVIMVVPVIDERGEMIGRLHGGFELLSSNFLGKLPETPIGRRGYVYLVDDTRTVIVHPDRTRTLGPAAAPGVNAMLEKGLQGLEGSGETTTSYGDRMLATTRWLKSVRWLLVSNYPVDELLEPIEQVRRHMLLAGLIGTGIAMALLFLALSRVTRPLSSLTRAIERMRRTGETEGIPSLSGSLEVRRLSLAFGDLFRRLKDRETSLRESEQQFRTAFESAPYAIAINRVSDGAYVHVNPAFLHSAGYRLGEIIGKTPGELFRYPTALDSERILEDLQRQGSITDREMTIETRDGRLHHIIFSCALFRLKGEDHVLTMTVNVTERKQAEMALRESEDRFRSIMEQSTFSMMVLSPDGNVLNVNQAHINLWGVSRELTKTFNILADPQLERLGLMPTIRRAMAGEQVSIPAVAYDLSATLGEGASKVVQGDFYPIRDANGAIHHIILIHQDITERKRMEEELRRHHENLEGLVRERTAEAERANRAKGEFLADMSHEIRTPLNAVIGYSQLLQRDLTLGDEQQAALATIARSGEHLLRLINDILDMAKIESGRISLEPEDVELHVLLRDLESMFGLRAREKGLWLRVEMDPDVPRRVHTDARRLQQVLFNLLSNAVKFTREGGVTLRAKTDAWGRTRLRFEVEDTGLGISAEERPRLFVPFSQSASGRSVREGTGLGLAISRRLVELMGGTLSCSSAPGQGSVFGFDIVAPPAAAADEAPSERLQVVRLKPGTRSPRVLVVEDHADSRQVLVKLLSEAGFEVQEAADGLQALSRWEEFAPEFIWMDINLPQLDGCEATQAIKKRAGGNGTVIVALTASAFDEDRRRIEACGIDGFLVKPYRETEIFETMGRLLGVEYEYREIAAPVAAARLGGASLEGLPPDLRRRLHRTVLELNVEGLRELAGEVGACDPQLRRGVAQAVESLDFSALLAAFDEHGGTDGT